MSSKQSSMPLIIGRFAGHRYNVAMAFHRRLSSKVEQEEEGEKKIIFSLNWNFSIEPFRPFARSHSGLDQPEVQNKFNNLLQSSQFVKYGMWSVWISAQWRHHCWWLRNVCLDANSAQHEHDNHHGEQHEKFLRCITLARYYYSSLMSMVLCCAVALAMAAVYATRFGMLVSCVCLCAKIQVTFK